MNKYLNEYLSCTSDKKRFIEFYCVYYMDYLISSTSSKSYLSSQNFICAKVHFLYFLIGFHIRHTDMFIRKPDDQLTDSFP